MQGLQCGKENGGVEVQVPSGANALLVRSHEETFAPEINKGVELFEHVPTDSADCISGNGPEHFSDLDYLEFMGVDGDHPGFELLDRTPL